jgi:phage terminase small subunit
MFVLEYIKDFNGARAATVAGYSQRNARIRASDLLTKRNIQIALAAFFNERRKLAKKTVDDIEHFLEKVVFTPITDIITFTRDGLTFIKDSDEMSEDAKAALESVEFSENLSGVNVKVRMSDKLKAAKLLGMQLGMFRHKVDVSVKKESYEQWRIRVGMDKE